MKYLAIVIFALLFFIFLQGCFFYYLIYTQGLIMDAILNPNSEESTYICECNYSDQYYEEHCLYETACVSMGHCPACPQTYEEELEDCRLLLKLELDKHK
jgi:hypothetical protein